MLSPNLSAPPAAPAAMLIAYLAPPPAAPAAMPVVYLAAPPAAPAAMPATVGASAEMVVPVLAGAVESTLTAGWASWASTLIRFEASAGVLT